MATCRRRRARRAWVGQRGGATSGVVRQRWGTEPGLAAPAEGGACDAAYAARPPQGLTPSPSARLDCLEGAYFCSAYQYLKSNRAAWRVARTRGALREWKNRSLSPKPKLRVFFPGKTTYSSHCHCHASALCPRSVARPQHRARSAFAFARPRHCPVLYAAHGGRACSPSPRHRFLPPLVFLRRTFQSSC